jgi:hypothetical protein
LLDDAGLDVRAGLRGSGRGRRTGTEHRHDV